MATKGMRCRPPLRGRMLYRYWWVRRFPINTRSVEEVCFRLLVSPGLHSLLWKACKALRASFSLMFETLFPNLIIGIPPGWQSYINSEQVNLTTECSWMTPIYQFRTSQLNIWIWLFGILESVSEIGSLQQHFSAQKMIMAIIGFWGRN